MCILVKTTKQQNKNTQQQKKQFQEAELLEQTLYYKTNENKHVNCDQVCSMPSFSRARYTEFGISLFKNGIFVALFDFCS